MDVSLPTSAYWQLRLGHWGEVVTGLDDIAQCLMIIVTTPPGSVPLRPEFGCDVLGYLDRPSAIAVPGIIREISRAVARWEPRAELRQVRVIPGDTPEAATVRLTWRPGQGGEDQEVVIPIRPPASPSPAAAVASDLFDYYLPGFVADGFVADGTIGDLSHDH